MKGDDEGGWGGGRGQGARGGAPETAAAPGAGSRPRDDAPTAPLPAEPLLPAVLAIDGGNTRTDAALVAADGTLLASARGAGVPGNLTLEQTVGVLGSVARLAATRAGLPPAGHGPRIARHLSACVANADLP